MTDTIELLSTDIDGNAVEGRKFPRDLGVVRYVDDEHGEADVDRIRLAYPHKFFRYDENHRPVEDSLVEFLVPDYMLQDGFPGTTALRLVEQRMGWAISPA